MKSIVALVCCSAILAVCAADLLAQTRVYKTVGPNGQILFSDKPQPDAQAIEVQPAQTYTPAPMPPAGDKKGTPPGKAAGIAYSRLSVSAPKNNEAVRANDGNLTVELSLEPALQSEHQIVLQLDGQKAASTSSTEIVLQNIERGTHLLRAEVVDAKGKALIRSQTIRFHVLRRALGPPRPAPLPSKKPGSN